MSQRTIGSVPQGPPAAPYLNAVRDSSGTDAMSPALDPIAWRFAEYAEHAQRARLSVLDIGCGDGIATAAALSRGAYVVAVDPDPNALRQLLARVRPEQWARLKVETGALPDLEFEQLHFVALHAGRVLHVLQPTDLRSTLQNFRRWLDPHGKLFVSAYTPEGRAWEPIRPLYEERLAAGALWPGFIPDMRPHFPYWNDGATAVHLLDEHVLQRELKAAGFAIEEIRQYPLPWDSALTCCGIVAECAT
jgi:polyketide synthase PksJ